MLSPYTYGKISRGTFEKVFWKDNIQINLNIDPYYTCKLYHPHIIKSKNGHEFMSSRCLEAKNIFLKIGLRLYSLIPSSSTSSLLIKKKRF